MHIFLTGEIQVGKSTLIRKTLAALPPLRLTGFRTVTVSDVPGALGSVYILGAEEAPLRDRPDRRVMLRYGVGRDAERFPEVFESAGLALLQGAETGELILMDEIGKAEDAAPRFCARVRELLDGPTPILGVLRQEGETPLQQFIRRHPAVEIITVTRENRDELVGDLTALLRRT